MAEYASIPVREDQWSLMEAEYNARWSQLAYLDGPGYTMWDRMEAKWDLQQSFLSRSSFHGVMNSTKEISTQPVEPHFTSSMAEPFREIKQQTTEISQEIMQSYTRILDLLQEEIDVSEALPTTNAFSASMDSIEEKLVTEESACVKNLKVESSTTVLWVPKILLPSTEEIDPPVVGSEVVVSPRIALPWRRVRFQFPPQITFSVFNCHMFDEMPLRNRVRQIDIPHQFRNLMIRLGVFNTPDKLPPPEPPDCVFVSSSLPVLLLTAPTVNLYTTKEKGVGYDLTHLQSLGNFPSSLQHGRSSIFMYDKQVLLQFHNKMSDLSYRDIVDADEYLLNLYCKIGDVETVRQVIEEMLKLIGCVYNSHLEKYIAVDKLEAKELLSCDSLTHCYAHSTLPLHLERALYLLPCSLHLIFGSHEFPNCIYETSFGLSNSYGVVPRLFPNAKFIYGIVTRSIDPSSIKPWQLLVELPLLIDNYHPAEWWIVATSIGLTEVQFGEAITIGESNKKFFNKIKQGHNGLLVNHVSIYSNEELEIVSQVGFRYNSITVNLLDQFIGTNSDCKVADSIIQFWSTLTSYILGNYEVGAKRKYVKINIGFVVFIEDDQNFDLSVVMQLETMLPTKLSICLKGFNHSLYRSLMAASGTYSKWIYDVKDNFVHLLLFLLIRISESPPLHAWAYVISKVHSDEEESIKAICLVLGSLRNHTLKSNLLARFLSYCYEAKWKHLLMLVDDLPKDRVQQMLNMAMQDEWWLSTGTLQIALGVAFYEEVLTPSANQFAQSLWSCLFIPLSYVDQFDKDGGLLALALFTSKGHMFDCSPGGYFSMPKTNFSSQFKQWDPGKFVPTTKNPNLEDKVVFKGEGNVMSQHM